MSALAPTVRRVSAAALAVGLLTTLAACGGSGDDKDTASSTPSGGASATVAAASPSAQPVTLIVLAASSLTDVFKTAGAAYEKENPGTTLKFSFAGSQDLAAQVQQGDPADALVTADTKTMNTLTADTDTPVVIAKNRLTIVTDKGNPEKIKSLKDLADSKLKVVLAAPQVPVGNYSEQVLTAQKIKVKPVSEEDNVRAVLTKVELGEADAGIVYITDAATAEGKVTDVVIPDAQNAVASYPAATVKSSAHAAAAEAFVQWLAGPEAQKILQDAGFQKP